MNPTEQTRQVQEIYKQYGLDSRYKGSGKVEKINADRPVKLKRYKGKLDNSFKKVVLYKPKPKIKGVRSIRYDDKGRVKAQYYYKGYDNKPRLSLALKKLINQRRRLFDVRSGIKEYQELNRGFEERYENLPERFRPKPQRPFERQPYPQEPQEERVFSRTGYPELDARINRPNHALRKNIELASRLTKQRLTSKEYDMTNTHRKMMIPIEMNFLEETPQDILKARNMFKENPFEKKNIAMSRRNALTGKPINVLSGENNLKW